MDNIFWMNVGYCLKKLSHNFGRLFEFKFFSRYLFEKLSSFTQLHNQNVQILLFVDLVKFDYVRMVQRLENWHLVEESLLLFCIKLWLFYFLCCSNHAIILSFHLIYTSIPSPSHLFNNFILMQEITFFDFDEAIPFHSNLFDCPFRFTKLNLRLFGQGLFWIGNQYWLNLAK